MATPPDPASPGPSAAHNMVPPMEPLTFTFGTRQIWTRASAALILAILLLLHGYSGIFGTIALVITVLAVLAAIIFVVTFRKVAVTLDRPGITVRGYRSRFIPWHEVKWIEPVEKGSTKRAQIVLTDGSIVKCRVPMSDVMSPDQYFGSKVAAMQQYHQAIGAAPSAGFQPAPPQPAPGGFAAPDRDARQRDPSQDYPTGQMPVQPYRQASAGRAQPPGQGQPPPPDRETSW
jgi:hypothetical protein